MKINNALKIMVLFVFFWVQCKNTPQKSSSKMGKQLFYLETTECMGTCPVFIFTVFANGACTYKGMANVDNIGMHAGVLDSNQLTKLKSQLRNSDFFNLELNNNTLIKDLPTKYLYYNDGDKDKTIMYYNAKNSTVGALIDIANELISEVEWVEK